MMIAEGWLHALPVSGDKIPQPERFTYPFYYEPHPLCLLAVEEVKRELKHMTLTEGKMFGVLVVKKDTLPSSDENNYYFLAAYSGLLEGRNDWPWFVPPVFDAQLPDGYFKQREREISELSHSLTAQSSPLISKKMSQDLQLWLFHQYQFLNARGEKKDLVQLWQDYHYSPRIQKKFPLPPGGTGDCCAPKLLQYAYKNGLKPICMAEFWWGKSEAGMVRQHGQFYPACRGKCKPVLTWMLQGLEVDPNPEELGFPHLPLQEVYKDDCIVVVNKPSGMLSIPGRVEQYSVASVLSERYPESLLAHRLDMGTSGLMVAGLNHEASANLQRQFEAHTVKKRYQAMLDGDVLASHPEHGKIELPLLFDPINRPRQVVDYERGKRAITEYRVLSVIDDTQRLGRSGRLTLINLYPHTGRTHQLRMHCAHEKGLGCPIVGDELYGHTPINNEKVRLHLHADRLTLRHPMSGKEMTFELPLSVW